ncbi:hypothetical protein Lal_00041625 [Lupinus albus]|uniref:Putative alpha/Beta hydrolase, strigolactone esterase D14 family n=1 Tax=Lupinus albus TaxID=3870 RepID=A0A6A4PA69_LUPAL|nr:putative alpha/Beta hydrolase, strigolactone esterase D14 family [Lupinus albus]KAF1874179.1 hypothetical protein Lal_00041625 [Lupinus albus]
MGIIEEAHNVRVIGKGNKIVVLAHGFGTDQSLWKHLVPHLVDEYRVILYDNMGAGTTNPEYYDFERFLNDADYYGGFEQEEVNQLFEAIRSNYKAWCSGFAPLVVSGDMDSVAVQEFSRTLFNVRPDIALNFVTVPCHIIQSTKDLAVPLVVAEYLQQNLGGKSIIYHN